MRTVFTSEGWAVNKLESDYGIDFDVEIFKKHKSTGEWFKVQLKSSESTQYSADGTFVSESLSSAHATQATARVILAARVVSVIGNFDSQVPCHRFR